LQAGRRRLTKATKTFEDGLQMRLGSAASVRSLEQFAATLTRLRIANRRSTRAEDTASAS
jgi:hypothetical protein